MPKSEDNGLWYIWSIEHGGWWGKAHRGYVLKIEDAGVYPYAEALEIVHGANKFCTNTPNEAMIQATKD